ncbi:hypothetical protein NA57DRAFT_64789 [Rhizodiscina lignyota]|uniref:CwfJ domain protein n=1 Tax=Rhizodiscina lignyota TaxID=1504668 RepID=A0A9P4IN18_9PEZI|nr:hypothetical protein NA57DRAFT_64789 [Rhizodiscina lignyota]
MAPSKLVVTGAVNGKFREVFAKIATLHSKNSFSLALIAGNLFADPENTSEQDEQDVNDLVNGKIEVALPTYFALGSHGLPKPAIEKLEAEDGELCHNLFFLGKRTTLKTSEGIRLVALGGTLDPNVPAVSKDKYPPFYSEGDAKALRGANSADILVTSQWPKGISTGSQVSMPSGDDTPVQLQCISDLVPALKPRYHFSTSAAAFYEREPFFHAPEEDAGPGYSITRFISLASYGNPNKAKWIYAFSLDTAAAPPVVIPLGTTASPFAFAGKKRPAPAEQNSYRFDTNSSHHSHQGRRNKRQRAAPPTPGECFFCLSNANLATHLITSIGSDAYMTTAKGPLSTASTFPKLGFPCHMLIIPLTHSPTLGLIEDRESRKSTYDEMQRFRSSLNSMLNAKTDGEFGSVTWEVSRSGGIHTHWQFLPVSSKMIRRGLVEAAFKVEAENEKYPALVKEDVKDGSNESGDFFRLIIWQPAHKSNEGEESKEKDMHYMLPVDSSFRFDLQFGRKVLAKLLSLESRMQWQDCGQSHEDEVGDVEAFKLGFKEWDFTLEE